MKSLTGSLSRLIELPAELHHFDSLQWFEIVVRSVDLSEFNIKNVYLRVYTVLLGMLILSLCTLIFNK